MDWCAKLSLDYIIQVTPKKEEDESDQIISTSNSRPVIKPKSIILEKFMIKDLIKNGIL